MSKENLEVVRRLFEAVERRDLAGVLAAYDSEITIREADSLPYGGVYHGFDGGQKHAAGYVQAWGKFSDGKRAENGCRISRRGQYGRRAVATASDKRRAEIRFIGGERL